MREPERYDLLVVGGGKGGKTLAMDMARAGRRVAMVKRTPQMIGGTCINLACIPSKTVIRSAEVAETARRAGEFGVGWSLPQSVRRRRARARSRSSTRCAR